MHGRPELGEPRRRAPWRLARKTVPLLPITSRVRCTGWRNLLIGRISPSPIIIDATLHVKSLPGSGSQGRETGVNESVPAVQSLAAPLPRTDPSPPPRRQDAPQPGSGGNEGGLRANTQPCLQQSAHQLTGFQETLESIFIGRGQCKSSGYIYLGALCSTPRVSTVRTHPPVCPHAQTRSPAARVQVALLVPGSATHTVPRVPCSCTDRAGVREKWRLGRQGRPRGQPPHAGCPAPTAPPDPRAGHTLGGFGMEPTLGKGSLTHSPFLSYSSALGPFTKVPERLRCTRHCHQH